MEYEIKGIIINWKIENNAKYIHQLYSPVFSLDYVDGTRWKLYAHRKSETCLWLIIKREAEDSEPKEVSLLYEFCVEGLDPTSLIATRVEAYTFENGKMCPEVEVDHRQISPSHFPDTITIVCKIYKKPESISGHIFLKTRIKTECQIFDGVVQNFKDISSYQTDTLKSVLSNSGETLMDVHYDYSNFTIFPEIEDMAISISRRSAQIERFFEFKFFLLNSFGKITGIRREEEFILTSSKKFTLPRISKNMIMQKSNLFLQNGNLCLKFEITFFSGIEFEAVERTVYENYPLTELTSTHFSNPVQLLTLKTELAYDTNLQTATEIIPAHTAVLSAHSPIFEVMFKSDMRESIQKCVQIDDIDAETVKRMLTFMYSNTVEEFEWKSDMKLYYAADKYQLLELKNKCAVFLRHKVDLSNCCVLFILSDIYQDKDLKNAVQTYITTNGKYIIYSDQWRELEKSHPHLVIEYFHKLFSQGLLF